MFRLQLPHSGFSMLTEAFAKGCTLFSLHWLRELEELQVAFSVAMLEPLEMVTHPAQRVHS